MNCLLSQTIKKDKEEKQDEKKRNKVQRFSLFHCYRKKIYD